MEKKECKNCGTEFVIEDEDFKFYDKISPVFDGKKYHIPMPSLCPDCRQQRRLSFRNEHNLYKRTCDLCKKKIISCYHDRIDFPVYCPECWWSDKWDASDYGMDFDFSRPFFDQFGELIKKVPRISLSITHNENSDYVNLSGYNKNSYLLFASEFDEDCLYGTQVIKCNDCVDALNCTESSYSYDVVDVGKGYEVFFSKNCRNCNESMFLSDCKSCNNCLFCTNLRNKQYHVFNKPVSKEEYEKKRAEIFERLNKGELPQLMKEFLEFDKKAIHKHLEMLNNENSIGSYLFDSKNCKYCYDLSYAEDCKYVYTGFRVKDLMDVCHTTDAEVGYEGTSLGYNSNNILFTYGSWTCHNGFYFDNMHSSSNIFGGAGMRHKKYCILNKQYSKAEYEKLVPEIIEHMMKTGEWGEFFPATLSAFAYNETLAHEYFPLTKEQVLAKGLKWKDPDPKEFQKQIFTVPKNIKNVPDSIVDEVLACSDCSKNYRIITQELAFYKKFGLPIPHECPDCRHKKRMALRNPRKLYDRKCDKCGSAIKTTYSQDRPEKIYCEKCYLEEIV